MDNENQVRANIFYKAAFYDRSAHIFVMREKESKDRTCKKGGRRDDRHT